MVSEAGQTMGALVGCGKDVIVSVVGNHWKVYTKGIASDFSFIGWRINCSHGMGSIEDGMVGDYYLVVSLARGGGFRD